MNGEARKAAVTAYKERKVESGIYAVRCAASGQIWVGSAPALATIQNRLWFMLRQGCNPHRSLQDAWTAHGAEAFTFETLDRLDDDEIGAGRDSILRNRLAKWVDELGAVRI